MEQDDEADDAVGGGAEDGGDGAEFGGALGVGGNVAIGEPPHAIDEEEDDAQQDEGIEKDDEEAGKVATNEAEEVVVPVVPDLCEGKLRDVVLRGSGKKEHYCGISDFSELALVLASGQVSLGSTGWMRRFEIVGDGRRGTEFALAQGREFLRKP